MSSTVLVLVHLPYVLDCKYITPNSISESFILCLSSFNIMKETNGDDSGLASDSDETVSETTEKEEELPDDDYKTNIVWRNVVKFIILHSLALYGLTFLPHLSWKSWLFLYLSYLYAGLGITAGAHRLWAHKSYKVDMTTLTLVGANPTTRSWFHRAR